MSDKVFGGYVHHNGEVIKLSTTICCSVNVPAIRNSVGVFVLNENKEFYVEVSNLSNRAVTVEIFDNEGMPINNPWVLKAGWKNISFSHYITGQKLQATKTESVAEGNGKTEKGGIKTIKVVFTIGQKSAEVGGLGQLDFRSGDVAQTAFVADPLFAKVEILLDYAIRAQKPSTEV